MEATCSGSHYKTRGLLAKTARILTSYFPLGQVKHGPKGGGRSFPYRLLRRPTLRAGGHRRAAGRQLPAAPGARPVLPLPGRRPDPALDPSGKTGAPGGKMPCGLQDFTPPTCSQALPSHALGELPARYKRGTRTCACFAGIAPARRDPGSLLRSSLPRVAGTELKPAGVLRCTLLG